MTWNEKSVKKVLFSLRMSNLSLRNSYCIEPNYKGSRWLSIRTLNLRTGLIPKDLNQVYLSNPSASAQLSKKNKREQGRQPQQRAEPQPDPGQDLRLDLPRNPFRFLLLWVDWEYRFESHGSSSGTDSIPLHTSSSCWTATFFLGAY